MHFRKSRALSAGGVAAAALLAAGIPAAFAGPGGSHGAPGAITCTGGTQSAPTLIGSGTYSSLTVSGICRVPAGATVTVTGSVRVARGGVLDTITQSTVAIMGNVTVQKRGIFALGCMTDTACATQADQSVAGSVTAAQPLSIYLHGADIGGNLTINGGGPGLDCVTDGYLTEYGTGPQTGGGDLPIKDSWIGGNVHVSGWQGCWVGLIRNMIGGSVLVQNNAVNLDPANGQGTDSTEIVNNSIGGNLQCRRNTPAAQYGDAVEGAPLAYGPNHVGGQTTGECVALLSRS